MYELSKTNVHEVIAQNSSNDATNGHSSALNLNYLMYFYINLMYLCSSHHEDWDILLFVTKAHGQSQDTLFFFYIYITQLIFTLSKVIVVLSRHDFNEV